MLPQPFFKTTLPGYFGGKAASGTVHRIINLIPKHKYFFSGFLGNCAVMRYKRPAMYNVGIDINPEIIKAWQDGINAATHPYEHHLKVMECNFLTAKIQVWDSDAFCYLDPPYPHATRTSRTRYEYEMSEDQHETLLRRVLNFPCKVAISTYDNPMYSLYLRDWNRIQFTSQTRGGPREETLYFNYDRPEPHELHDTRFLGDDYRAREKSTRRIKTILGKIDRLTPVEQARIKEHLSTLKL